MEQFSDPPEGYKSRPGISPAVDHIGPFYYRREDLALRTGFRVRGENCNGIDSVHGGVLMAFADYTATVLALVGTDENCATISFSSDFIAPARLGDWVEGTGEVIRRTGSMTFIRGQLELDGEVLFGFQAVMRRLRKSEAK